MTSTVKPFPEEIGKGDAELAELDEMLEDLGRQAAAIQAQRQEQRKMLKKLASESIAHRRARQKTSAKMEGLILSLHNGDGFLSNFPSDPSPSTDNSKL